MAENYKVLSQNSPAAATAIKIYTVPSSTSTVISSILVCNRGTTTSSFRLSIRVAGEADAGKQYIYYNLKVPREDTFAATLGITITATDEIWVYAEKANQSFQIFGTEIS